MPQDEHRTYELLFHATDAGMDQLAPYALEGEESFSTPFRVSIDVRTMDPGDPAAIDPGTWLRKKASVGLARGGDPTWFHGIVMAVEHLGADHEERQLYRIELGPAFALLKHTRRTRVFRDQKPVDVVRSVLSEGTVKVDLKATGAGGVMRHITQYEESDFDFVSRLLEQEGACYWFTHVKTDHTMVIGDTATHHPGTGNAIHGSFAAADQMDSSSEGVVTALTRRFEIVAKDATVRDYSEGHPKQAAMASKSVVATKAPGAGGKHDEADYHVTTSDADATAYAGRLADALVSRSCRLVGASGIVAFRAGARVAVHGKDGYDEHMVLSQVRHTFADQHYTNAFSATPVSRLPWRPLRTTPIPRINGVIPAIVTATAGDQGAGEDGSYKVKILNADGNQERIMRMAQPYAGPAQGFHFPLPINTEVLLSHEYGHPDRPIIAGAMHNAEDPSPVVDANKSQCVVKSAAGAVLIFEDKSGEEKVTLQSKATAKLEMDDKSGAEKVTLQSKALHKLEFDDASGSEKVTLITKGTQKLEFLDAGGSEKVTLYAKKDHEVTVDGKSDTKVAGNKTIDCQAEIEIKAASKITLSVGGSSIVITSSKIEISSPEIKVTASAKAEVTGAQVKIAGSGQAELSSGGQTAVKGSIVMIN